MSKPYANKLLKSFNTRAEIKKNGKRGKAVPRPCHFSLCSLVHLHNHTVCKVQCYVAFLKE